MNNASDTISTNDNSTKNHGGANRDADRSLTTDERHDSGDTLGLRTDNQNRAIPDGDRDQANADIAVACTDANDR